MIKSYLAKHYLVKKSNKCSHTHEHHRYFNRYTSIWRNQHMSFYYLSQYPSKCTNWHVSTAMIPISLRSCSPRSSGALKSIRLRPLILLSLMWLGECIYTIDKCIILRSTSWFVNPRIVNITFECLTNPDFKWTRMYLFFVTWHCLSLFS